MQKLVAPKARRLKCDDPRVKKKWIAAMKAFAEEKKLQERIKNVERRMVIPLPP